MINNSINKKILKTYNFIKSDKYNNEFEFDFDEGFWCYDRKYLGFLFSELNLKENSSYIYLLKYKIDDVKDSSIMPKDCFIEFCFNGDYIIRNKKCLNIIYHNENIVILNTGYTVEIFIFKEIQTINKLEMLMTI